MKKWIVFNKETGAVLREGSTIDEGEKIYCAENEWLFEEIIPDEGEVK